MTALVRSVHPTSALASGPSRGVRACAFVAAEALEVAAHVDAPQEPEALPGSFGSRRRFERVEAGVLDHCGDHANAAVRHLLRAPPPARCSSCRSERDQTAIALALPVNRHLRVVCGLAGGGEVLRRAEAAARRAPPPARCRWWSSKRDQMVIALPCPVDRHLRVVCGLAGGGGEVRGAPSCRLLRAPPPGSMQFVPSKRCQTAIALPCPSTATSGKPAFWPAAETSCGAPKVPPAARTAACTM